MDYQAFAQEAKEVELNEKKEFQEVPAGEYECAINKMELKEAKSGADMISVWWEILDGTFKGQILFQNVVLAGDYGKHNYKRFMQEIKTSIDVFNFSSREELEEVVLDVFDDVIAKYEYLVKVKDGKNGFKEFEIKDVFNI